MARSPSGTAASRGKHHQQCRRSRGNGNHDSHSRARPEQLYVVAICACSGILLISIQYENYARFLKWLTLLLLAYVAVAFDVPVDSTTAAVSLVRQRAHLSSQYLFFWQASQEVEEMPSKPEGQSLRWISSFRAYRQIERITADTRIGMVVSNGVGFFIMLTAAATLHAH